VGEWGLAPKRSASLHTAHTWLELVRSGPRELSGELAGPGPGCWLSGSIGGGGPAQLLGQPASHPVSRSVGSAGRRQGGQLSSSGMRRAVFSLYTSITSCRCVQTVGLAGAIVHVDFGWYVHTRIA
jgi:hypothetical protein